ncbi:MAG TPA: TonB-dependent receptor [Kofleriaceae bacterium]|nr:TonB-dependent receptor [Kofleriaceae bacterium]
MLAYAALVSTAHADDYHPGEIIVLGPVDAPRRAAGPGELVGEDPDHADAARALDEPAFTTVVRVDDRAAETATVAEVLAHSLGVNVRGLGGLGGFSAISVRGHGAGHTVVMVDGVPLSRVATVGADLGRFELTSFSELELYRGGVPVEYGGAAMGGALNLVTRVGPAAGPRLRVSAGGGSFGARHLRTRWLGGDDRLGYHVALGYAGATGDFEYFDDNGTNLEPGDDTYAERSNNGFDAVDGVARLRASRGPRRTELGARTMWKRQGVPGSAHVQSERSSIESLTQIVDASRETSALLGDPRLGGKTGAYLALERQHYLDVAGEVGLGAQDRVYHSISGGLRASVSRVAGDHVLSAGLDASGDYFQETDRARDAMRTFGSRVGLGLTASDDWTLGRVVIQPAVRLDLMYTDPIDDVSSAIVGPMDVLPRTELFPSPRAAARLMVAPGTALKGSAGWYFRAPTLVEIYGDRGYVVGNPGLGAETGQSVDLGVVHAPAFARGGLDRVYLEAVGFGSRSRDTIVMVPTAGLATAAINLGDALIYGGELGASARFGRTLTLSGNYTLIDSRQSNTRPSYEGKRLPQRPRHQGYLRADLARRVRGRLLVLWTDATVTSGNYLDPANISQVPTRRLLGVGLKLEPLSGLLIGLDAKNLADERVEHVELSPPPRPDLTTSPRAISDFYGYPLPGRTVYLTAEWTH